MLTTTKPKQKTCRCCKGKFTPARPMQVVCGLMCGMEVGRKKAQAEREKAERAARALTRKQKQDQKKRSAWQEDAQTEVNAFVRGRDKGQPCISCGTPWAPDFQAGHYRSRGAAKHLALDPRNIHGQCVHCNMHKHSNALEYRIRLVERCGIAFVEAIESDQAARHYSIDDLKAIRADFIARRRSPTAPPGEAV